MIVRPTPKRIPRPIAKGRNSQIRPKLDLTTPRNEINTSHGVARSGNKPFRQQRNGGRR